MEARGKEGRLVMKSRTLQCSSKKMSARPTGSHPLEEFCVSQEWVSFSIFDGLSHWLGVAYENIGLVQMQWRI